MLSNIISEFHYVNFNNAAMHTEYAFNAYYIYFKNKLNFSAFEMILTILNTYAVLNL